MKVVILLLYFGATFPYYVENLQTSSPKNLFEPAQSKHESHLAMIEGINPTRAKEGILFQPAPFQPWFRSEMDTNLQEQVANSQRDKRGAAGALHILTNHAQPIHADVKPDGTADVTEKVTSPEDTFYELKSLRKSWPLPSKLELARRISRVITLAFLIVTAIVEFFPLLKNVFYVAYWYINL